MNWQTWIAAVLVLACAGYSLWTMLPAPWRRRLEAWRGVRAASAADSACGGCAGCGSGGGGSGAAQHPGVAVIRIVRSRR